MALSKENTRTMVTISLDLKKELDLKSERDGYNLNTVIVKAIYDYLKKDSVVDKKVLKDTKHKLERIEYLKFKKEQL
ncbi:hypothetical protein GCM10008904_00570 [Paraclostridium ghonii]|uniref:Uncharacterized protein n=1 Tax=Paraclostridium ghonii TaxID=29358 RepID=A0ABU0MY54_9FIRM|nr:hypothetical protein [Paeniclostridium ghonii]MCM0165107.1 hypothetical protein [Paeniclostridium ghonii]MDQ0555840.1 hypothetical protein [Paeniclostridium ghonii]